MLKLSEQEKQEIIRYIESDRELPEKYRFLLFEDKREVELVWNGKTGEFATIKSQAGLNSYKISVKYLKGVFRQWRMK